MKPPGAALWLPTAPGVFTGSRLGQKQSKNFPQKGKIKDNSLRPHTQSANPPAHVTADTEANGNGIKFIFVFNTKMIHSASISCITETMTHTPIPRRLIPLHTVTGHLLYERMIQW